MLLLCYTGAAQRGSTPQKSGCFFEHFTLKVGACPSRALQEHCKGWTQKCEFPQSVCQGVIALGHTGVLVQQEQPCSFRDVNQQQLGLGIFLAIKGANAVWKKRSGGAREWGHWLFVQGFERLFFPLRLPRGGLGSRYRFICLMSSRLSTHRVGYQLK